MFAGINACRIVNNGSLSAAAACEPEAHTCQAKSPSSTGSTTVSKRSGDRSDIARVWDAGLAECIADR